MNISNLKEFQKQGVTFLTEVNPAFPKPHRILAFDMGLGKTPTSITAAVALGIKRLLIICPATLKEYWKKQLINWGWKGAISICVDRNTTHNLDNNGAVICNFEQFRNIKENLLLAWLADCKWDCLLIDEIQRLKEPFALQTQTILGGGGKRKPVAARANHIWGLTGTPAPNHIIDLFVPLRTLAPELMSGKTRYEDFGFYFCGGRKDEFGQMIFKGATHTEELFENIKPFMMIVKAEDVDVDLPDAIIREVFCDVEMAADESNTDAQTLRKEIGLEKVPFIVEHVKSKIYDVNKMVLVCYNRAVIAALYAAFETMPAITLCQIHGDIKNRDLELDNFIQAESPALMLLQINAAGEGLDKLQRGSNYMVICQPEWPPGLDAQVIGRIKRIGQTEKCVYVDRILCRKTQDDYIHGSRKKKIVGIEKVIRTNRSIRRMSLEATLERIAVALETLAGNAGATNAGGQESSGATEGKKGADAKSSKSASDAEDKSPKLTLEDCRKEASEAIATLTNLFGDKDKAKAEVVALVKKAGSAKLDEIKPAKFASFIKDIKALVNEALTADTGSDDDI